MIRRPRASVVCLFAAFGRGLSYARFVYGGIGVDAEKVPLSEPLTVLAVARSEGAVEAEEVVQPHVADLAFRGREMSPANEPGISRAWIGGDSVAGLPGGLDVNEPEETSPARVAKARPR